MLNLDRAMSIAQNAIELARENYTDDDVIGVIHNLGTDIKEERIQTVSPQLVQSN